MLHSAVHFKGLCELVVIKHPALKVFIEGQDDLNQFLRYAVVTQDLPERLTVKAVKGLLEIDKYSIRCTVPLP